MPENQLFIVWIASHTVSLKNLPQKKKPQVLKVSKFKLHDQAQLLELSQQCQVKCAVMSSSLCDTLHSFSHDRFQVHFFGSLIRHSDNICQNLPIVRNNHSQKQDNKLSVIHIYIAKHFYTVLKCKVELLCCHFSIRIAYQLPYFLHVCTHMVIDFALLIYNTINLTFVANS